MAADHTPFLELAQQLLDDNGQNLVYSRIGGTIDPVGGRKLTPNTPTTWKLVSVVLTLKESDARQFPKAVLEEATQKETRLVLAAPAPDGDVDGNPTFDPRPMDRVAYESATWQVLGAVALKPRDVTVLYKMVIGK